MNLEVIFMECNVGSVDSAIRVIISAILVWYAYSYTVWWLYIIALVLLLTAVFGCCKIYTLFGISTCKLEKPKKKR